MAQKCSFFTIPYMCTRDIMYECGHTYTFTQRQGVMLNSHMLTCARKLQAFSDGCLKIQISRKDDSIEIILMENMGLCPRYIGISLTRRTCDIIYAFLRCGLNIRYEKKK